MKYIELLTICQYLESKKEHFEQYNFCEEQLQDENYLNKCQIYLYEKNFGDVKKVNEYIEEHPREWQITMQDDICLK